MIRPRKVFAQHWLKSEKALDAIIRAAECRESDGSAKGERVLEIGPGTGILTRRLLPLVQSLIAVEIDRDLCHLLSKQLGKTENFLLLQGDFLTLDLPSYLVAFPNFQKPNKVVANIPYNITGPIIEKLLGTIANPNPEPFDSIVLLVQKEVAERLYAKPGSKTFGALSVRVQYLAECELICTVPAAAFHPPPKVDSAVVRLRPRKIEIPALNPRQFETFLKLGFGAKRKMLRNNLQSVIERDRLSHLLEQLKINPQARAEDISVQQWVILANELGVGSKE
ncbi:16S rRNA (adenine(1518)-N(6)/adenine(1519)-N(6))-dimethyltransferase [Nostoc sp. 'Peltigera membranacea cyanobiont' 213]|uniref:16S rRNA (adenine(1518)-N(6)/adenine(1519)-N(6))- dimethyltransferase RsmA n=1 Tax=unclassified Nostoc TaxID=2593658 RepID=UPI000B954202|nr:MULTISPECIES: 16S rRNA (adenine(1518)-N(6)/adenine(1519)-N(6))-dimethyltransferase RsmA [unclassified Nostoc]AVH67607.1 16S rRNA methyltransferase [Nostoc sp. 'Peltigera membranacea cyanobiont' N6]OYD95086.1 16S rRNA (adenine(1518)-N(6)/adenine(1519)-N(6))-dimethyltransferase [Nostoc sp. 'Peltigera membranacea cyanobiont' 213]